VRLRSRANSLGFSRGGDSARAHDGWPRVCHLIGRGETNMIMILMVILVLMLLGAVPAWPHSRSWGYAPSGTLGLVLIILLLLVLSGRI
jgi:hypothetical protein